uniref:Uncharacterized protein n=1 Tax=Vespula pensylvanica TaxID=30213 RepID=A0A834U7M1_VESPE|nr:hypothetical protein H0235_010347 [Vespula pensylvanica]
MRVLQEEEIICNVTATVLPRTDAIKILSTSKRVPCESRPTNFYATSVNNYFTIYDNPYLAQHDDISFIKEV